MQCSYPGIRGYISQTSYLICDSLKVKLDPYNCKKSLLLLIMLISLNAPASPGPDCTSIIQGKIRAQVAL